MRRALKIIQAPTTHDLKPGTGNGVARAKDVSTTAISAQVMLPIRILVRGSIRVFVCSVQNNHPLWQRLSRSWLHRNEPSATQKVLPRSIKGMLFKSPILDQKLATRFIF
jgi:hypothetical protein